ncbi:hypothetical protein [Bacillus sp. FJAT-49736]|uniref:TolB family protein n=1 Tax=Bacillus sp. FJAT-49736 TaxID=2833582 RepID=UPI001BC994A4|nr:hypothetical protein [Bacillus sp. FJAT-49736]MBS4174390.1 hypothetical protein [Bacillus sp. FJAT-49736]
MDAEKIEKHLHELKKQIYVDDSFKHQLRIQFVKKPKSSIWKKMWLTGVACAVLLFGLLFNSFQTSKTKASALNIMNSISFFDVGSGEITAYAEYNGQLLVSIKKKGIYRYVNGGLAKITSETADTLSQGQFDDHFLFSHKGEIYLFDLKSRKKTAVIRSSSNYNYSNPEWKTDSSFFAVRKERNELKIVEIDLKSGAEKIVVTGDHPSFIKKEQKLVLERQGKIIVRNISNGNEKIVDDGKNPSVSPDGSYISYVKKTDKVKNVWISDLNMDTKKKVTMNLLAREKKQGQYEYLSSIWSTSGLDLYVLKKYKNEENQPLKIMKVSLSAKEISPEATVERYLQALIVRDDDYAKSMMEHPPEFLTYSNPHQTGFQILNVKKEKDVAIVRAEVYWTYTANPYDKKSIYEFKLMKKADHYLIKEVKEIANRELTEIDGNVQYVNGESKENLFSLKDVPKEFIQTKNIRISSLLMDHDERTVIFCLQEMREEPEKSAVTLLQFNRKDKSFRLFSQLNPEEGSIVVEQLSLDSTGQYIAVDYFVETKSFNPNVRLLDVKTGKEIRDFRNSHTVFWQGEQLVLEKRSGDQSMLFLYDPRLKTKKYY